MPNKTAAQFTEWHLKNILDFLIEKRRRFDILEKNIKLALGKYVMGITLDKNTEIDQIKHKVWVIYDFFTQMENIP